MRAAFAFLLLILPVVAEAADRQPRPRRRGPRKPASAEEQVAYTPAEATGLASVSRGTILKAIRAGTLSAKRTSPEQQGRVIIRPADLRAWVNSLDDA